MVKRTNGCSIYLSISRNVYLFIILYETVFFVIEAPDSLQMSLECGPSFSGPITTTN